MGLAVVVGPLADALEMDPEYADDLRAELELVNKALRREKVAPHHEPDKLPELVNRAPVGSFPYSCLHYLRRAYAHSIESPGKPLPPVADPEDAADDPIIERVATQKHHLLWHSDAEGYYVPVDFESVVEDDDIAGGAVGSSQRLLRELLLVAPVLGIRVSKGAVEDAEVERLVKVVMDEGPLNVEIMVWLLLYESARLSVEHRTAILFS